MYSLLHFVVHDVTCALRAWEGHAAYDRTRDDLLGRFERYSLADMVRGLDEHFPGEPFALPQLFLEERALATLARLEGAGPLPERVGELIREASGLGLTLDLLPAKPALQRAVQSALAAVAAEPVAARVAAAQRLIEDARALGLRFGLWQAQNRF